MTTVVTIESIISVLASCAYRIILLSSCLAALLLGGGEVNIWFLFCAFVLYVFLFILLKVWNKHFLRTVLDYLLIFLILYGRNVYSPECAVLLLIPLFNSPNFTGPSSIPWPFVFSFLAFVLFDPEQDIIRPLALILPLFAIWCVFWIKKNIRNIYEEVSELIDESFNKYFLSNKLHMMHQDIISKLHANFITKSIKIRGMYYFVRSGDKIIPISGSNYVKTFIFHNKKKLFKELNEDEIVRDWTIKIRGYTSKHNVVVRVNVEHTTYLALLIFSKDSNELFKTILLKILIKNIIPRVVRLIHTSKQYRFEQKKNIETLKEKMHYIESTDAIIHFLNNKFGPIQGFISQYKITKQSSVDKLDKNRDLLDRFCVRAESVMEVIKEKNKQLLSMQQRIDYTAKEKLPLGSVYSLACEIWAEQLDQNMIEHGWSEEWLDTSFETNRDGLFLLFSELTDNVRKYGKGEGKLCFQEDAGLHYIVYTNPINPSDTRIKRIVAYLNEGKGVAQAERYMSGTKILLLLTKQLGLEISAFVDDRTVRFMLQL